MTWKVHMHYMDTAEKYTFKLLHNRVFFLNKIQCTDFDINYFFNDYA